MNWQARVIPAVADMSQRGLFIDPAEHRRQVRQWSAERDKAREEYRGITGDLPPATRPEIRQWLAATLGSGLRLGTWPRTPTGELSTARGHLKRLILSDVPGIKQVLGVIANDTLLSIFGDNLVKFVSPATGRIHAHYNIAGAASGRFSASRPNLQQLPAARAPEFKRCIVPAPGNVLVCCDWNQVELRAAAWLSGDKALTAIYRDGGDLHKMTAAAIAGVTIDKVTPEQRAAAKPTNFGALYGIGAESLAVDAFDNYDVVMSVAEAEHALARFFATYHELDRWRHEHAALCQARGYVKIGAGRVHRAEWEIEAGGRLTDRQCTALKISGTCADVMLRALRLAFRRLRGLRGGIVASLHDEILVEAVEDDAEAARAILEETMIEAFETTFPGAPLTNVAKAGIGRNWIEAKEGGPTEPPASVAAETAAEPLLVTCRCPPEPYVIRDYFSRRQEARLAKQPFDEEGEGVKLCKRTGA